MTTVGSSSSIRFVSRFWAGMLRESRSAGLSPRWASFVWWLPLVGGLLVAATIAHKPLFHWLLREDRPVEWAQFTCCLFAGLVGGLAAVRLARKGQWLLAALYVLFALAMIVLAGEEISWAQRALGLAEPSALESVNVQGELNLHNVELKDGVSLEAISEYGETLMSLAMLGLSLLVGLPRATDRPLPSLARLPVVQAFAPSLAYVPALALSGTYPWLRFLGPVAASGAYWSFEEWVELCRYLALAGLAAAVAAGCRRFGARRSSGRLGDPVGAAPAPDLTEAPLLVIAVVCVVVTIVLALMTMATGIQATNLNY